MTLTAASSLCGGSGGDSKAEKGFFESPLPALRQMLLQKSSLDIFLTETLNALLCYINSTPVLPHPHRVLLCM